MGYIHCCGGLHKTKSFAIVPHEHYKLCELDLLKKCPVCENTIVQLTRVNSSNEISVIRYKNAKAEKFFQKMKSKILYEEKYYDYSKLRVGKLFLYYNEYGVKKRCYSNLSNMKKKF